jgi:hypothetical protein
VEVKTDPDISATVEIGLSSTERLKAKSAIRLLTKRCHDVTEELQCGACPSDADHRPEIIPEADSDGQSSAS